MTTSKYAHEVKLTEGAMVKNFYEVGRSRNLGSSERSCEHSFVIDEEAPAHSSCQKCGTVPARLRACGAAR